MPSRKFLIITALMTFISFTMSAINRDELISNTIKRFKKQADADNPTTEKPDDIIHEAIYYAEIYHLDTLSVLEELREKLTIQIRELKPKLNLKVNKESLKEGVIASIICAACSTIQYLSKKKYRQPLLDEMKRIEDYFERQGARIQEDENQVGNITITQYELLAPPYLDRNAALEMNQQWLRWRELNGRRGMGLMEASAFVGTLFAGYFTIVGLWGAFHPSYKKTYDNLCTIRGSIDCEIEKLSGS